MKEITKMPMKVSNGNKDMEVYEYEDGFAMTTEFLGQCLGYKNPKDRMANLFSRNKEVLEPHRFTLTARANPQGGRPTTFYDSEGCVLAASRAGTPEAKLFLPLFLKYLKTLEARRMERIEAYWFGKRPFWPEIRERVMLGQTFREIGDAMDRKAPSVRNAVKRMIEVGILQTIRAIQAVAGTTQKTLIRYSRKFMSPERQPLLPGFDGVSP